MQSWTSLLRNILTYCILYNTFGFRIVCLLSYVSGDNSEDIVEESDETEADPHYNPVSGNCLVTMQ